jgi:hypothetical protein
VTKAVPVDGETSVGAAYLVVELGVHILGHIELDVPGLGAGIQVAAGEAHGLGQQSARGGILYTYLRPPISQYEVAEYVVQCTHS